MVLSNAPDPAPDAPKMPQRQHKVCGQVGLAETIHMLVGNFVCRGGASCINMGFLELPVLSAYP